VKLRRAVRGTGMDESATEREREREREGVRELEEGGRARESERWEGDS
jgi:hypothetical protein